MEGVYFFIFSIWGFERADKRGIGVVGSELRLLYCFRFLSGIEMLEPSSSETCGTDEVIGGKKEEDNRCQPHQRGAEKGRLWVCFFDIIRPLKQKKKQKNKLTFFKKSKKEEKGK